MKNYKKFLSLLFGFALVVLVLAACGGASSDGPSFPTGRFNSLESKYVGYQFNDDKTWVYYYYGEHAAKGTYKLDGNQQINLLVEQGTEGCADPGTYAWSYESSQLTFKLIGEDECDPRRESTAGQIFTLSQ